MPKSCLLHSTSAPVLSRRGLASGGAALLALASTAAIATPVSPDAELVRLCAAFDVLERQYQEGFAGVETGEEWDRADAAADVINEQQAPILDAICACRPSTLEGFRALANSLALWDAELLKNVPGEGDTNDRLAVVLFRGMLGRQA